MLLTLSAKSLLSRLRSAGDPLALPDMPTVASQELGLRGLCVQTDLLAGVGLAEIDRLRDRADKSACPCLLLIEEQPHALGDGDEATVAAGVERLKRVVQVAHRLGCAGIVVGIKDTRSTRSDDAVAASLKKVVAAAERLELNVLVAPQPGLTQTPEQLTGLIRKVGGFRIGSFPDFEAAAQSGDATRYLRGIVPYAAAISVPTASLDGRTRDPTYNLPECLRAIRSVGYDATLTLECRGGDPSPPINAAREAIEAFLEAESE